MFPKSTAILAAVLVFSQTFNEAAAFVASQQRVFSAVPASYWSQFEGDSVLRCQPLPGKLDLLLAMADDANVDMWTDHFGADIPVDFRVSGVELRERFLENDYFACTILIEDISAVIADQTASASLVQDDASFYANYHSFDELVARVKDLAEKHPSLSRFVPSIGKSTEGRDLVAIHITAPDSVSAPKKKTVWFNGGIHAREWISSHVVVSIVESLLTNYETDPEVQILLQNIEFVISPHVNPDGYEYSRTSNRMWRKNRSKNEDGSRGVDLNRNYDIRWGTGGSSRSPGSDTYMGPYANSEPETKSCVAYIKSLKNAVVGIDFHSFSQLVLRPYGYSLEVHPEEPRNKKLGDGMRDAIKQSGGAKYVSERSADLYPVTGGMDDWITSQGLIGFTIELRDTGRYGFLLPKEQILPTCKEIWAAVKYLGNFVINEMPNRDEQ